MMYLETSPKDMIVLTVKERNTWFPYMQKEIGKIIHTARA
jgi:hypothetical protein